MTLLPIVVYAGTCAAALGLASRFLRRISLPWAAAIALLPLLVTGKAVVTGGYFGPLNLAYAASPLASRGGPALHRDYGNGMLTDVAFQMVPWQAAVRNDLRAGRAPLWNPFILCGDVLAGAGQPAPFHPSSIIGLLLPLASARTFAASFAFFLGALCAFLFLSDVGLDPAFSFLGAAAWMLSLHFLFWTGWPQAQSFATLPLMMAGARRLARAERGGVAAAASALFLALVGGHPESAFHAAAVSGLYFLWELRSAERRGRTVAAAVGTGLLAFALAAPAVLPVLEALPQSAEGQERFAAAPHRTSNGALEAARSAAGAIFPDWYGRWLSSSSPSAPSFESATAASVGGIALVLAALALGSPRREKWPLAILAAATFTVAVGAPGLADLVGRLPVFRLALNNRLASATAFLLAALAAIGLEELARGTLRRALILPLAAAAAAALAAWRRPVLAARGVDPGPLVRSAAFFCGGLVLLFLWRIASRRTERFAWGAVAVFLAVRCAETPRPSPTFAAADFYPPVPELARIPRGEPERIVGVGNALQPNQSALWGLEDVRGYEGVNNARFLETYPLWSTPQRLWFNRVDDPSRPFLRFLNVRYAAAEPSAAPPPGWNVVERGPSLAIFANPAVLPRAFAPRRVRFVSDPSRTVAEMEHETDFSGVAWIEAPDEAPREIENGRAEVRVREDGPGLLLDVDAAAPAWIVASETNWKGWRARENNTRFPVGFADHAFVGFRVPAGRHRVRLEYRPRSFAIGLALAGLAVLGLLIASLRPERRSLRT